MEQLTPDEKKIRWFERGFTFLAAIWLGFWLKDMEASKDRNNKETIEILFKTVQETNKNQTMMIELTTIIFKNTPSHEMDSIYDTYDRAIADSGKHERNSK